MNYFYFNPFSKQYFFPENFHETDRFLRFYQPFKLSSLLAWKLWYKFKIIRNFCSISNEEARKMFPFSELQQHISGNLSLCFNKGTPGPEQKLTVLGVDLDTGEDFFVKYATSSLSRKNVLNEATILQQLDHIQFVPAVKQVVNEERFIFIRTNCLDGIRVSDQEISGQILTVLKTLSQQTIKASDFGSIDVSTCFSHGDFCPWNMMLKQNLLQVYDWELAGYYPLGYDLFTYIFQTSFLLTPNLVLEHILSKNLWLVEQYFLDQKVTNWTRYLVAFATLKFELETQKDNRKLTQFYKRLIAYASQL